MRVCFCDGERRKFRAGGSRTGLSGDLVSLTDVRGYEQRGQLRVVVMVQSGVDAILPCGLLAEV